MRKNYFLCILLFLGCFASADSILVSAIENYKDNNTITYSTNGHEKANGLELSMQVPDGLKKTSGKHMHVLDQFSPLTDNESLSINLVVDSIESEIKQYQLTDYEILDVLFNKEELAKRRNILSIMSIRNMMVAREFFA